jgi:hypothetical protein
MQLEAAKGKKEDTEKVFFFINIGSRYRKMVEAQISVTVAWELLESPC